jgi:hypothetical protein
MTCSFTSRHRPRHSQEPHRSIQPAGQVSYHRWSRQSCHNKYPIGILFPFYARDLFLEELPVEHASIYEDPQFDDEQSEGSSQCCL